MPARRQEAVRDFAPSSRVVRLGEGLPGNLAPAGGVDGAPALVERVASYANVIGLPVEAIDLTTGALLGNDPQDVTLLALICSALTIVRAEDQDRA